MPNVCWRDKSFSLVWTIQIQFFQEVAGPTGVNEFSSLFPQPPPPTHPLAVPCPTNYELALFKSPCGGGLTKTGSVTFEVPSGTFFLCLGDWRPRKTSELQPKTSHYARFWAQNAGKTTARTIPESVTTLFFTHKLPFVAETLKQC